jgi:hypothetical protein
MCTVTFIPAGNKIYLTSNRDEKHWRSHALAPAVYTHASGKLLFPKDGDAGGTWIAAHETGQAIVFLNGAFIRHTPQPPYRKSRGLVLLELVEAPDAYRHFHTISLEQIEPFTAIIWSEGQLFECRWNGEQKFHKKLNARQPYIWSSATLYDEQVAQKRAAWFNNWLQQHNSPSQQQILHFHQFTGEGDAHNDLRMNRNGQVFTVSVTSMAITASSVHMQYVDLKNNQTFTSRLAVEKSMAGR